MGLCKRLEEVKGTCLKLQDLHHKNETLHNILLHTHAHAVHTLQVTIRLCLVQTGQTECFTTLSKNAAGTFVDL